MPNYIEYYDNEGHFDVAYSGEPEGKKAITNTDEVNVALYATAQIVDDNLIPENIAKGKTVLGIQGTHEGGITARVENEVLILSSGTVDNGVLIL